MKNSTGNVLLELRDGNDNFIKGISQKITNKTCIIIVENINSGKYSFKYFHDENNDVKLNTNWLGLPTEGFGFSNNTTGTFGPPSIEKTIFEVKSDVKQKCSPIYY